MNLLGMPVIVNPLLPDNVAYLVDLEAIRQEIMKSMFVPMDLFAPPDACNYSSSFLAMERFREIPVPKMPPLMLMPMDLGPWPAKPYRRHSQCPKWNAPHNRRWRRALARWMKAEGVAGRRDEVRALRWLVKRIGSQLKENP